MLPNKQSTDSSSSDMSAFFLVGATACGKTAVAQWIAERYSYDILSADSMLVYKGMDIGTAKPSREDLARVNYHGIDLLSPDESFNVWRYREHAMTAVKDCMSRQRKLLVVGGTGLYIKSLTDGLSQTSGPDDEMRRHWFGMLEDEGIEALQSALKEKDLSAYKALADKQNPRRLIRALENARAGFRKNCRDTATHLRNRDNHQGVSVPMIGLTLPIDVLAERIETRVEEMYRDDLCGEVNGLIEKYGEFSKTALQAIGYAEVRAFLDGRCSIEDAKTKTITRTRQLAKRQRTWFKNQANVEWIELHDGTNIEDAGGMVLAAWRKYGPTPIA
ncbi:MAG: tRNA (adenosine(37)-N6)-dimethylallyltransferase MiaA [Kiritimatiellae bacterium]|nr:tRNA (adenosine(37)-N6)-dimethylallyltransferase MiaA [Kiritimatiellia bacterium]